MLDFLLYVREDAGRELPGSGLVLVPGTPLPANGVGAELAAILVARGDCVYCDEHGSVPENASEFSSEKLEEPAPQNVAEHTPEPADEVHLEPNPEPAPEAVPEPTVEPTAE